MSLVVSGLLNKQIASELGASETTVKIHRGRVMEKMTAGSLVELVRMADKLNLATSERIVLKYYCTARKHDCSLGLIALPSERGQGSQEQQQIDCNSR